MRASKGFTLIELLIAIFAIVFVGIGICGLGVGGAVFMGNQWFTEEGVFKKIQLNHSNAVRIVDSERNVFQRTVITVEQKDGKRVRYCLDSDILFNYTITACER